MCIGTVLPTETTNKGAFLRLSIKKKRLESLVFNQSWPQISVYLRYRRKRDNEFDILLYLYVPPVLVCTRYWRQLQEIPGQYQLDPTKRLLIAAHCSLNRNRQILDPTLTSGHRKAPSTILVSTTSISLDGISCRPHAWKCMQKRNMIARLN